MTDPGFLRFLAVKAYTGRRSLLFKSRVATGKRWNRRIAAPRKMRELETSQLLKGKVTQAFAIFVKQEDGTPRSLYVGLDHLHERCKRSWSGAPVAIIFQHAALALHEPGGPGSVVGRFAARSARRGPALGQVLYRAASQVS